MNRERREKREKLLFKDESYAIQGAVFDVYRDMGCGFLKPTRRISFATARSSLS